MHLNWRRNKWYKYRYQQGPGHCFTLLWQRTVGSLSSSLKMTQKNVEQLMEQLFLEACMPHLKNCLEKIAYKHSTLREGYDLKHLNPFQFSDLMEIAMPYMGKKTEKIFGTMADLYFWLPEYKDVTLREFFYFMSRDVWPIGRLNWDKKWREKLFQMITKTQDLTLVNDSDTDNDD